MARSNLGRSPFRAQFWKPKLVSGGNKAVMARLALLTLALATSLTAQAQLPQDFEKNVDSICKEWNNAKAPGGVVGVAIDGKLVFAKGYGLANLETGSPNTPDTVMDVGSVSKQVTAMCILLLEEEGKLKTSDDITEYVPEVPTFGEKVTLDHLLHMTSGLRDYLTLMAGQGWNLVDARTFRDALDIMSRQTGANSKPGEKWNYCNAGYMIMATIVERVSGESLARYAREHVFEPLDMKTTRFVENDTELVRNRSTSYAPGPLGTYMVLYSSLGIYGDGGLYTTLADFVKWHENFYHNQLGKKDQKLIDKMLSTAKLNDGKDTGYACGLQKKDFHGHEMFSHGGNWLGFNAMTARVPDKHMSVLCFGNDGTNLSSTYNQKIASLMLGIKEPEGHTEITLPEEALTSFEGIYNLADGRAVTVSKKDKQLLAQMTGQPQFPIFPESENRFFLKVVDAQFEFTKDASGKVTGGNILQGGAKIPLTKGDPFKPTDEQLKEFAGHFQSFEMDMEVEVNIRDNKLFARIGEDEAPLTLVAPGKATAQGMTLLLMKDKTGAVRGFTLDMGRASGMKFLKRS